ncbi:hypothetical protein Egran_05704 [Elaphomyces granulatus]|uniref:Myosin class II heavy chain n=1 Tax=Elaphomyces granulatus TaxID=519963 RepID=A0A232LR82_9EURO|nr:hypothetical protein Egran_05704 [Elaphomyces granulatus]
MEVASSGLPPSVASSPPLHSIKPSSARDGSDRLIPLIWRSTSPEASSVVAVESVQQSPRSSSPNPPLLPALRGHPGAWDSLSSSPEHRKAESSAYYTAVWGSPYATPARRPSWTVSQQASGGSGSGRNSPISLRSGRHQLGVGQLDWLERTSVASSQFPRRLYSSLGRSVGRDLVNRHGGRSNKDFTEDWILSGPPRPERTNWLSDDSGSEAPSFITAHNHFADDLSDSWLGFGDDRRDEDLLGTPTLSRRFVSRGVRTGSAGENGPGRPGYKHASHHSTATLRQEDFWGFAYDQEHQPRNMFDGKDLQLPMEQSTARATALAVEKPLPPPPVDTDPQLVSALKLETTEMFSPKSIGPQSANASSQRSKRRVAWRSKACIISVPLDDTRGSAEKGYPLLARRDIEQRLKAWEDAGYDIRGFDVSTSHDHSPQDGNGGMSRESYPDSIECLQEWKAGEYFVRFPNQEEWNAYVNFLKEEKLRALGVSLGFDEPQSSISPVSVTMSHVAHYPGLVASPPVPTPSSMSNPLVAAHAFSPHFNQSANAGPNLASLTSPAPFVSQQPFENLAAFPYHTPPTHTPQSLFNMRQAGVASTGPANLARLGSILSPVSALNPEDSAQFHSITSELPASRRDSIIRNQANHGTPDAVQRSRSTTLLSQRNIEPERYQPEIAQPTPRGHSHNLSETINRYSQADYHLEESIQRQLEEHDREPCSGLMKSRWAMPDDDAEPPQSHLHFQKQDSFSQRHHHLFGENLDELIHDSVEIDTNPSLAGTPHEQDEDMNHHPWHSATASTSSFMPAHNSGTSVSTLNVEAKAFNPLGSFSSNSLAFEGTSFQPSGVNKDKASSIFKPAFPPANAALSPFNNQGTPLSNNSFTFASPFNVDAPIFNPSQSANPSNGSDVPASMKRRITSEIDFSEASQQRSKAIPIVRPGEEDVQEREKRRGEVEEGVQSYAPGTQPRQKRARRDDKGDDQDIEFATPTLPLNEAAQTQPTQVSSQAYKPAEGKENEAPEDNPLSPPDSKALAVVNVNDDEPVDSKGMDLSENSTSEPSGTPDESETVISDAPMAGAQEQSSLQNVGSTKEDSKEAEKLPVSLANSEKVVSDPVQDLPASEAKRSTLSATAKPFSFTPSVAEFVPVGTATSRQTASNSTRRKSSGLMGSRYAVTSPPMSPRIDDQSPEPDEPVEETKVETSIHDESPEQGTTVHESLDEQELNAVMEQLNGDDSDVGVERLSTPAREPSSSPEQLSTGPPLVPVRVVRSDAPSPSPRQVQEPVLQVVPRLGSDFDSQSPIAFSQPGHISGAQSPVRQLISVDDHISDWGDVFSSGEDEKFVQRSKFFDRHVNDIVGNVLEERLGPLEEVLNVVRHSVESLASRSPSRRPYRSTSAEIEHSDADDEDEGDPYRPRSPISVRDRKLEKMKNAVLEALASHQLALGPPAAPGLDLTFLHESIAELKALATPKSSQDQVDDLKRVVQDVISTQLDLGVLQSSDANEIGAESLKLQVDGLKSMLRIADERSDEEHRACKEAREALLVSQKQLMAAEEDAFQHRKVAEDAEFSLRQLTEEKIPHFEKIQMRSDALAKQQEYLEMTLSELSEKNIALEGTLDEHRVSGEHWRREITGVKTENKELLTSIDHLKVRIEESTRTRQNLCGKFDRLQDDMVTAARNIAREQATWRKREEELNAKYDTLRAAYDREVKLREKLELNVGELEQQEREAAKLKFIFGQSQQENVRLGDLVATLRQESQEYQNKATLIEREYNQAQESSRVEVERTRASMEADVEAANNQVNFIRSELEAHISRLEHQLETVRTDAETARERYDHLLAEAKDSKTTAVVEISASKDIALDEQRMLHERGLNDLRERHARALHNASDDRQRTESLLTERLELANEKVQHLEGRVAHLEEKLEIAISAARAAAQAAQAAKGTSASSSPAHPASPSMSFRKNSLVPERISPQALRESILVLQDQLQQREARIEELEHELSSVDVDAPSKIKDKDTEINWLRELLGVRIDDLQDIIETLSLPSFDQNAIRDAAIRLKANLQMEQQEKERANAGSKPFPFAAVSNLASSPRSLPLAAAAAWGNWRKGRDSNASENTAGAHQHTPSKTSNGSGFLSGLLTPPSSNVRQSPKNAVAPLAIPSTGTRRSYSENRPLRAYNNIPQSLSSRQVEKLPDQEAPTTPPLLRKSSYDHDAGPSSFTNGSLMEDNESVIAGLLAISPRGTRESPFGPQLSED